MQKLANLYRDDYEREKALQKAFESFINDRISEWSREEMELLAKVNVSLSFKVFEAETELERWAEAVESDLKNA